MGVIPIDITPNEQTTDDIHTGIFTEGLHSDPHLGLKQKGVDKGDVVGEKDLETKLDKEFTSSGGTSTINLYGNNIQIVQNGGGTDTTSWLRLVMGNTSNGFDLFLDVSEDNGDTHTRYLIDKTQVGTYKTIRNEKGEIIGEEPIKE